MSVFASHGLQFKVNSANNWTVMCKEAPAIQTNIFIPNKIINRDVTKIAHEAFYNDSMLEGLKIPETIERIGHHAFSNCYRLAEILMKPSENEIRIRYQAFQNCTKLKRLCILRPAIIETMAYSGCKSIALLDGQMKILEDGAFEDCVHLQRVNFHKSVEIADDAFYGCNSIREIVFMDEPVCSDWFIENVLSNVKIKCRANSRLANLAYDGFCVELI